MKNLTLFYLATIILILQGLFNETAGQFKGDMVFKIPDGYELIEMPGM